MFISGKTIAVVLVSVGTLLAAEAPPELPPLPSELPVFQPATNARVRRAVTPVIPANPLPQRQISLPQFRPAPGTNAAPASYQPKTLGDDIIRWDAIEKEYHAQAGEVTAPFTFSLTNVSTTNVVINFVRPSCGCTIAKLPPTPWTLKPGESGIIDLSVDLRGKYGTLSKYVSVDTSHGQKFLMLKIEVPQQQQSAMAGVDARTRNMQMAMVDRQVVFKGDCAKCHAAPTVGKVKGEELFASACAVCHDAPHRATMVPDLRALKKATGPDYWKTWITHGKPGTLMPGFSKTYGGPLSEEQISTLAAFMYDKFPRADQTAAASGGPAVNVPNNGPSQK
jgi:mono/diheme cytochrome c family protein